MVAQPEDWLIDGTSLSQLGWGIETRDGWDDTPPVRGENTTLLGRHGAAWNGKKWDQGKKTLILGVHGVLDEYFTEPATRLLARALYEERLDNLLRLVGPRERLLLVERLYAGGYRRRAFCEVLTPVAPVTSGDSYGQVTLELTIPGAFWEDSDPLSYLMGYEVGGLALQSVEQYGLVGQTAPCGDAVVTVTGPCDSVAVKDAATGAGWSYPHALDIGDVLVVDSEGFTAAKNGVDVVTDLLLDDSQLLEISAAPAAHRGPLVDIDAPAAAGDFAVRIDARRRWLR